MPGLIRPDVFPFAPDLGPLETRLTRLARAIARGGDFRSIITTAADQAALEARESGDADPRIQSWAFSLSVLGDIAAAGGTVHVRDSSILVSWPNWSTKDGKDGLRDALTRLRAETRRAELTDEILQGFPGDLSGREVLEALTIGEIRLADVGETHPGGAGYRQLFSAASSYWTMPVRDREGRNRRFVLAVTPPAGAPMTAGILEVGDGAPHSTPRDELLGFTPEAFMRWFSHGDLQRDKITRLISRIDTIRRALRPPTAFQQASLSSLYDQVAEIEAAASGRSKGAGDLFERKKLTYLARITRAHRAALTIAQAMRPDGKDLYALVRLLRDLTIPRLHLEITLCGGLPPFAAALSGKLVLAHAADPRIVNICAEPVGEILSRIFDPTLLQGALPISGAALLTTKGLFAEHSAQYTKASLPSVQAGHAVPLRKIGLTAGVTASLLSRRTYEFAQSYLTVSASERFVSDEFGSGGSKRQRRIEAAVKDLGLPVDLIHPKIARPIYGVSLVENLEDVAILNAQPRWRIPLGNEYSEMATALWRERWLATARRRLADTPRVTGLRDWLIAEATHG